MSLTKVLAALLLAMPLVVVVSIGAAFVTASPTRRDVPEWLSLAPRDEIPMDGHPVQLNVLGSGYDAWTRYPDLTVAHVYARHDVQTGGYCILPASHGRYRVPIEYDCQAQLYTSRCFKVRFDLNGVAIPDDPSATQTFEDMKVIPSRISNDVVFIRLPSEESFTKPL